MLDIDWAGCYMDIITLTARTRAANHCRSTLRMVAWRPRTIALLKGCTHTWRLPQARPHRLPRQLGITLCMRKWARAALARCVSAHCRFQSMQLDNDYPACVMSVYQDWACLIPQVYRATVKSTGQEVAVKKVDLEALGANMVGCTWMPSETQYR